MDTAGRVLVATSNVEFRAFLTHILTSWHLQAFQCSNIADARQTICDSHISLVFCDKTLPDGDFAALLNFPPRLSPPKIVVLLSEEEQYADTIARGAFDALPVPCQRQDVQWMLIQAMREDKKKRVRFDLPSHINRDTPQDESAPGKAPTSNRYDSPGKSATDSLVEGSSSDNEHKHKPELYRI
jgi:DNA-binding NtrC family response regulator